MAMKVPLLDLKAQLATIRDEVKDAVDKVIESQQFILGPEVEAMEREMAEYCGCRFAVGVSSGTDALLVALMALGVKAGDEVVTTPFTFFATAGVIHRLGAKAVFADMEPETFNVDPSLIEKKITPRTKAILPVHLFGQCAEMGPILDLARGRGIPVVEDAAQAIGAEYRGRRAGSMGALGCFSFFPSKNLGAFGDGGLVTTNDEKLAELVRKLRVHGALKTYVHSAVGGNFRLDALQAAVLRVKLKRLDGWSEARRKNADDYNSLLAPLDGGEIRTPARMQERHIYNQYVLRAKDRDRLAAHLASDGIGTAVYYPIPLHLQECFSYLGGKEGDCPESEKAAGEVIALPVYPELTPEQKACVAESIKKFYGKAAQAR